MEVLPADSNSSDALKEDKALKVNGEMNGSVEGMEVDEESVDGAEGASDESVCGSSRPPDPEEPNSHFGSEVDAKSNSHIESEGDGKSNFESEGDGKSNKDFESDGEGKNNFESDGEGKSHFGSEYEGKSESAMDVDGLAEVDGESVNSEDEDHLLHSDNEDGPAPAAAFNDDDAEGESEEEGDINGPDDEDDLAADKETDDDDEAGAKDLSETGEAEKKDEETPTEERNGTVDQVTPSKKKRGLDPNLTPRRSSRTVQKPVRFGQELLGSDEEEDDLESDGIEEIPATDPLADPLIDKENRRFPRMIGNTTIVVSDTKRLADIAVRSQPQPKKEPTLVIIDTNSILSGRGAMPLHGQTHGGVTITQQPAPTKHYQPPAPPPKPKPPQILPTLTDDMYVVEAPSFIVPYVYEKPPVKKFKKYLKRVLKEVRKQDEERRKQEEAEDAEEEKLEKLAKEAAEKAKDGPAEEEVKKEPSDAAVEEDKDVAKSDKVPDEPMETDENSSVKIKEQLDVSDEETGTSTKVKSEDSETNKIKLETEEKGNENKVETDEKKEEASKEAAKPDDEGSESEDEDVEEDEKKKTPTGSYFDNPLGKFFMQIGMNLVQEFVQTDLLKQQKKKQKMGKGTEETQAAIASLKKNLIMSKESNQPYNMEQTKCEFCSFKSESKLIMAHHLETPHMRNYVYRCNFCPLEVRGPHDILYHMEVEHVVRGRLERAPAFHQCPQCPFEDNQKGKLTRHLLTCAKKFRPEKNLDPPPDWEPPAKIPRLPRKPSAMPMGVNNPLYAQNMGKNMPQHLMPKMGGMASPTSPMMRPQRGRPTYPPQMPQQQHKMLNPRASLPQLTRGNLNMFRSPGANNSPVMLPSAYQISNNQLYQVVGPQGQMMSIPGGSPSLPSLQRLGAPAPSQQKNPATVKLLNQPSISITPLPRQTPSNPQPGIPPVRPGVAGSNAKPNSFVICEICDGYIKDLEQLRNHMQWIHKVKIHPKMIYNRPPLNCQKCQFRFFTDQGLERHLLGSHGLVTSSMQDQANRGKDGGRCPVCGRVYQWKLLNHVARDHNMTLKPAHLSYKCTVCTATFGMYKQFESHVYSAHSVVAKRVMDKKNGQAPSTSRTDTATLLKPLKINDEITIIPQPAKKPAQGQQRPVPGNYRATPNKSRGPDSVQVIDLEDSPNKSGENGSESLTAVKERLRRRQSLEIRQVESEPDETDSDGEAESSQAKPHEDPEEDEQGSDPESDG